MTDAAPFPVPPASVPVGILIVDDHDAKRAAIAAALEPLGEELVLASSGREALRCLLAREFAVVLLDVRMPDLDGFETATLIRARKQSERTPIIFVTAHERAEADMLGGYALGAVDYLFSPFRPEVLRAKVGVFVDLHRKTQEVQAYEARARDLEARAAREAHDRLRREADLETRKWRLALEQAADPVFVTDRAGRVEQVNRAYEAASGLSRADAVGRLPYPLDEGAADPAFAERARAALRSGAVFRGEVARVRPDGLSAVEELALSPIHDDSGEVVGYFGSVHDVTARRAAEAEARSINALLEARVADRTAALAEANRELEAFASSVSHDLRTPLRHIVSFAQLLEKGAGAVLAERERRHLEQIGAAALRMNGLIDDLLAFSRTRQTALNVAPVDLRALAEEVWRDLAPDLGERRVEFALGPLPTVPGDRAALRQVFANLLSNALKYTRPREVARVEVTGRAEGGEAIVEVRDNGVGFDPRFADKLFGVFSRLHHAEEFEGTGIGLANVQRIVAKHRGRVWAESREGEGATFAFALPTG